MKNSFIRLLLRDIKNYIRTNRFFLIAEAALFLIGCMIADMQKPDSYGKYTTIQYYMQIFRGCQRGRHSCSAAGKEQSLVVVQQMSCANRVESALLCSRLLLCMRILLFYKWFVLLYHFAV